MEVSSGKVTMQRVSNGVSLRAAASVAGGLAKGGLMD